jgi:hypothetical protein
MSLKVMHRRFSNNNARGWNKVPNVIGGLDFRKRGWEADLCHIQPSDPPEKIAATVRDQLVSRIYDCVVMGTGLRLPTKMLRVFEIVVNTVHAGAPRAAIAFNTHPKNSGEAAARWVE